MQVPVGRIEERDHVALRDIDNELDRLGTEIPPTCRERREVSRGGERVHVIAERPRQKRSAARIGGGNRRRAVSRRALVLSYQHRALGPGVELESIDQRKVVGSRQGDGAFVSCGKCARVCFGDVNANHTAGGDRGDRKRDLSPGCRQRVPARHLKWGAMRRW